MKKIAFNTLVVLFAGFGACNNAAAQWIPATSNNSASLCLQFVNSSLGFQGGQNGYLSRTSNGGVSWETLTIPTKTNVMSIDFPSNSTGYVGTSEGIMKTTNFGVNWANLPNPGLSEVKAIDFYNDKVGWVCTNNSKIGRTIDGGITWEIKNFNNVFFTDLQFASSKVGWAVGSSAQSPYVYKTIDGGISWTQVNVPFTNGSPVEVDFFDENYGWISTFNGEVLITTDGGQTWASTMLSGYIYDVQFLSETVGFLASSQGLFKSIDGGISWTVLGFTGSTIFNVGFTSEENGSVGTTSGVNAYTIDGGVTWTKVTEDASINSNAYGVQFTDGLNGWCVGELGLLRSTNDGGLSWQKHTTSVVSGLYALDFISASTGWVIGGNGTIIHTSNNGVNWSLQSSGTTEVLYSVDFVSATHGIIVGANGKILRTTDGGATWNNVASGTVNNLRSVSFVDANVAYIVGINNTILKTINGGLSWTSIAPAAFGSFGYISSYFSDASNGFAVGLNGTIIQTTDGGVTWNQINTGVMDHLIAIHFNANNEGWIVGYNAAILHTTDGGATWQDENLYAYTAQPFNALAIKQEEAYCVGNNGVEFIYKDHCNPSAPLDFTNFEETQYCAGTNTTTTLLAAGYGTISWYDAPNGGNYLGSGNAFTTPSNLTANTSYYVQDSTCTNSPRTLIEVAVASIIPTATIELSGNEFSAIETGVAYQWMNCDSNTFISAETNQYFIPGNEGNYSVIVNLNGCETTSDCLFISFAAVDEVEEANMQVYPNPFSNQLVIDLKEQRNGVLRIISAQGETIIEQAFVDKHIELDMENLSKGLYIVELNMKDEIIKKSIVKN